MAIAKGAEAVIVDVSENEAAGKQVSLFCFSLNI